jgi:hypothetical protein
MTGGVLTNGAISFRTNLDGLETNLMLQMSADVSGLTLAVGLNDAVGGSWSGQLNYISDDNTWKFSSPIKFPDDTVQGSAGITTLLAGTPNVTLGTNGSTITINVFTQDLSGLLAPVSTQSLWNLTMSMISTAASNTLRGTLYINDALRISRWFSNAVDTVFAVQTPGAANSMARMYHEAGTGVVLRLQAYELCETNGTILCRITTMPLTNIVSTTGFSTLEFTNGTAYIATTNATLGIFPPTLRNSIVTNTTVDGLTVSNGVLGGTASPTTSLTNFTAAGATNISFNPSAWSANSNDVMVIQFSNVSVADSGTIGGWSKLWWSFVTSGGGSGATNYWTRLYGPANGADHRQGLAYWWMPQCYLSGTAAASRSNTCSGFMWVYNAWNTNFVKQAMCLATLTSSQASIFAEIEFYGGTCSTNAAVMTNFSAVAGAGGGTIYGNFSVFKTSNPLWP